jgi:hypothetical protein
MIIGAIIGLAVILFFLLPSGGGDPAWGKFWWIRPLLVVPFAGAMGGLCNYFLVNYRFVARLSKPVAIILSVFIFIVGLWMGIILGLDGTMWN